jgi:hypothetical protein
LSKWLELANKIQALETNRAKKGCRTKKVCQTKKVCWLKGLIIIAVVAKDSFTASQVIDGLGTIHNQKLYESHTIATDIWHKKTTIRSYLAYLTPYDCLSFITLESREMSDKK